MLFDPPYLAHCKAIKYKCQWLVNDVNDKYNVQCINYDYAIVDKVLIINEDVDCKAGNKHIQPFPTTQENTNGTVRIDWIC